MIINTVAILVFAAVVIFAPISYFQDRKQNKKEKV